MGVRYRTVINKFPEMQAAIETVNGKKIQVGVLEGENAWLASIHEYGCNIAVTPKMRTWLRANGLPLKSTTNVIRIPERAFLRNGHDENIEVVMTQSERALGQVLAGKMSSQEMCDLIGQQLATKIKTYARNLSSPSNHPFTIERKGSSNPLVSTGDMIEGITWKVEG